MDQIIYCLADSFDESFEKFTLLATTNDAVFLKYTLNIKKAL